jgi:subtilisin-like proprotein convertase family protein
MKKFTFGIILSIIFVLTGTVNAQISTFPYTESFEAGAGGWATDAGLNDAWDLGTPAGDDIIGASDGTEAWATNLTGNYNTSSSASVVSPVFDFSAVTNDPTLIMDVWWNSEFSWDGARVETSVDGGANWSRLGAFGDPLNWYNDTTVLGDHGWTGRNSTGNGSGGWVEAEHALDGLAGQSSVTLRVFFGSDSSVTDDGFAFDNVRITTAIGAPPVIACPADVMINTTGGICTGVANWADPIVFDLEDGPLTATQTAGPISGDAIAPGAYVVTYEATDSDGNTVDCSFNVTVSDNEDPIAVCQDISLDLDASGLVTITAADLDNGSSDNCGILTSTLSTGMAGAATLNVGFAANNAAAGNMFEIMALNPITVNSFDISANAAAGESHNYEVYFKVGSWEGSQTTPGDWTLVASPTGIINVGPGLATPLNLSLGIDVAAGELIAFYVTASDGSTLGYTGSAGTTGVGNLWASDDNIEFYEGAGKGYPFGSTFSPRVWNGNIQYETGVIPFSGTFDCSNIGVANVINVTHTDAAGNSTTCQSTVTISDVTAPIIICIGEQVTGPFSTGDSPALAIVDNTTVSTTLTVTDDFVMTDLDVDLDITHTWVGDMLITLESPAGTQVLIFDGGSDGCSGDNIVDRYNDDSANALDCQGGSPDAFPLADYIPSNPLAAFNGESTLGDWILSIEDTAGGDSGTLNTWNLLYDFAPIVAAPLEVVLDASGLATINASDLLLNVDEACGWTASVPGAGGGFSLTTTFDGGNGNFGNMFDVNALSDLTVNSFDVHGEDGVTFDVDVYAKSGTWVGFETDAAAWTLIGTAPGVVSNGTGVPTPLGLALDYAMVAGETHAFFVTPQDTSTGGFAYTNGTVVGSIFAADANMEILEGAGSGIFDGTVFQPRNFNGNLIYSSGSTTSATLDLDCSMLGENLIEITVTDDSGNIATCMATVTVLDETAPVLVCTDVTLELGPDGTATVDPLALLGTTDSTFTVLVIGSDNQGGNEGFTDLTVPVTDAASVSFDWDYVLNDVPGFDGFGYLLNGTYTQLTDPAVGDQTGSETIAVAPGDVFGFRSQTADNLFGNNETVISNFLPGFTGQFAPANWTETLTDSDGSATFVEIPGGPLSFDACGIANYGVSVTEVNCDDLGTPVTVTVFATDASGNSAACTSIVTVIDALAPIITCPADQTVDPGTGNLFYEVPDYIGTGEATADDNCTDPVSITTQSPAAGSLVSDGTYTVTITGEDSSGNVGTCSFQLTVESVLGVESNELNNAISMYPNPAQDRVTISNTSNIQLEKAVIFDLNGKMLNQIDLSTMQGEQVINISDLASGVYVVQLTSDTSSAIKRLIKE